MVRGLDGCFYFFTHTWRVQFSSSTERLAKFRWCIAKGRHLFPFRTEQLSLSAPMVLGGHPPGRVGRRRFFVVRSPRPHGRGLRAFMGGVWNHGRVACVALCYTAPHARGPSLAPKRARFRAHSVASRCFWGVM